MRSFFLIILCLFFSASICSAQFVAGTTGNTVLTNIGDNVGMGTTSPALKAHIVGALGFPATSGTAQTGVLRLQGTGQNGVLDFSVNGASGASLQATAANSLTAGYHLLLNPNGGFVGIGTTNPTSALTISSAATTSMNVTTTAATARVQTYFHNSRGDFSFGLNTDGRFGIVANTFVAGNQGMWIDSIGRIGINTASPAARLQVAENTGRTSFTGTGLGTVFLTNSTGTSNYTALDFSGGFAPTNSEGRIAVLQTNSGSYLSFGTSNLYTSGITNTALTIDPNGNVGVGTTTPAAKLDVRGGARLDGNLTFNADKTAYFITGPGNGGAIRIRSNIATNSDRNVQLGQIDNAGNWYSTLTVTGGFVGIGTTSPDQMLTVNGTVHSTTVLVEATVPTPDYVFDYKYILRSLEDVKSYVEKNHHLPEVPSAAELKKNGMDLGKMNTVLLKKVEELTLYMIKKDQQLVEQKKINAKVQKQLDGLNRKLKRVR